MPARAPRPPPPAEALGYGPTLSSHGRVVGSGGEFALLTETMPFFRPWRARCRHGLERGAITPPNRASTTRPAFVYVWFGAKVVGTIGFELDEDFLVYADQTDVFPVEDEHALVSSTCAVAPGHSNTRRKTCRNSGDPWPRTGPDSVSASGNPERPASQQPCRHPRMRSRTPAARPRSRLTSPRDSLHSLRLVGATPRGDRGGLALIIRRWRTASRTGVADGYLKCGITSLPISSRCLGTSEGSHDQLQMK